MGTVRLIAQTADLTTAEMSIGGHYRATIIITHATHIVVGWIDEVFNTCAPSAGTNNPIAVGLHIECTPPNDTIALLQLCVGNRCLVYQLLHRNDRNPPDRLKDFLNDGRFCFISVDVEMAITRLRIKHGLRVRSADDLGDAASRRLEREDLLRAGLDKLAREVIGIEIIRLDGAQRSALFQRVLPVELVAHVCMDAIFSHDIGRILFG